MISPYHPVLLGFYSYRAVFYVSEMFRTIMNLIKTFPQVAQFCSNYVSTK